jgi:phospholipid transport system transporter-binding protein
MATEFTLSATEDLWRVSGELNLQNAASAWEKTEKLPLASTVDFSELTHSDSAALSFMLALKRRARSESKDISLQNIPENLRIVAKAYGIDALL